MFIIYKRFLTYDFKPNPFPKLTFLLTMYGFARFVIMIRKMVAVLKQRVTKRCRLSLLTNSALVYEPKCGGIGRGSQPMSTAVHIEPK